MHPRERWQALQARLKVARAAVDAGDRTRALAAIGEALDIDPDFLAARMLRDRILAPTKTAVPVAFPSRPAPAAWSAAPVSPAVAADDLAKFEQRAKRRLVDRRLGAARAALQHGRLKQAATALDEAIELDPDLPEVLALTAQFHDLRRRAERARRGPRLVASAVFLVTVVGASWLQDWKSLISRTMTAAAPVVASPAPIAKVEPIPTFTASPVASSLPTSGPTAFDEDADETLLVGQAVQRYRATHDLQKSPPAASHEAVAGSSGDLPRHARVFDRCEIQVRGEVATATCQIDAGVWRIFILHKTGGDWTIEGQRADQ